MPARTVYDDVIPSVATDIAGGVADVAKSRCEAVDIAESARVERATGGNGVYLHGNSGAKSPGADSIVRVVPGAVVAAEILAAAEDDGVGSVHAILQLRAFDGLKIGIAIVGDLRLFEIAPINRGGLRDIGISDGVLRLLCPGDTGKHARLGRSRGDATEIIREFLGCDRRPRAFLIGSCIPPARKEHEP